MWPSRDSVGFLGPGHAIEAVQWRRYRGTLVGFLAAGLVFAVMFWLLDARAVFAAAQHALHERAVQIHRTTVTGTVARSTICFATLPSIRSVRPERPRWPTNIAS